MFKKLIILVFLLSLASTTFALPARVVGQIAVGGGDGATATPMSTGNFPSSVTAGNYIICGMRESAVILPDHVSDTLGSTWSLAKKNESQDPWLYIYYAKLASSGTNAVSFHSTGSQFAYGWIYCVEVTNLAAASVLDSGGTDDKTGVGGTSDLVSNSITTTQADEYIFTIVGQNSFNAYTAGTNVTLIDGTIPTNTNNFGGVGEKITSSTFSGVLHFTSDGTNQYTMITAAFKGDGSGGGGSTPSDNLLTLGVSD